MGGERVAEVNRSAWAAICVALRRCHLSGGGGHLISTVTQERKSVQLAALAGTAF